MYFWKIRGNLKKSFVKKIKIRDNGECIYIHGRYFGGVFYLVSFFSGFSFFSIFSVSLL